MRYGVIMTLMILGYVNLGMAQVSPPIQRESLRYLPGVTLAIEEIEADAKADGLSEEAVHKAVERTLPTPAAYRSLRRRKGLRRHPNRFFMYEWRHTKSNQASMLTR